MITPNHYLLEIFVRSVSSYIREFGKIIVTRSNGFGMQQILVTKRKSILCYSIRSTQYEMYIVDQIKWMMVHFGNLIFQKSFRETFTNVKETKNEEIKPRESPWANCWAFEVSLKTIFFFMCLELSPKVLYFKRRVFTLIECWRLQGIWSIF